MRLVDETMSNKEKRVRLRPKSSKKSSINKPVLRPHIRQLPTCYETLYEDFNIIILEIIDGDKDGRKSGATYQRKTIKFYDGTKMYCTEYIDESGLISFYQYDWYSNNKVEIMKFHSEGHPDDENYQTVTDPFHVHKSSLITLHGKDRYENFETQNLRRIIEYIFFYNLTKHAFVAIEEKQNM